MILGTNEKKEGILTLTPEERERFLRGELVTKQSGDAHGMFTIEVRMTRPADREKRFPAGIYEPGYQPPEQT